MKQREINGYCKSIEWVKEVLESNGMEFEEKAGKLTILSAIPAGDQYNIEKLFYCANIPLDEFEYGTQNVITYFELDMEEIVQNRKCGCSCLMRLENLGNGMLVKEENSENFYIVLNHDYVSGEVTMIQVSNSYLDIRARFILCEDISLSITKQSKNNIIVVKEALDTFVFSGYITPQFYQQLMTRGFYKPKRQYEYMHDFEKHKLFKLK